MQVDRRTFIAGAAVALNAAPAAAAEPPSQIPAALSQFALRFMAARNAPGMILGLADTAGWSDTARYGVADIDSRRPIGVHERFHIGSISKSFTALMILQLLEEGKLRLDADVRDYLPGLPLKTPFGPVTIHGLLCHSSGLPSSAAAPGWPDQTIVQTYAPGSRFYYSNYGYGLLGDVVVARGGESWSKALHRRILDPLGMTETSPLIGASMRRFEVPSFFRREDDRPFPRRGALTRAAPLVFTAASGCIASTAADMNRYIRMIARRGQGPNGRLISPAGFALLTKRHIEADEFGPGAGYGYGWAIDRIDGNAVVRHTGGMESFMSSIHVDLDAGFGAFASINAQQNYRPVPVTQYALALHRAAAAKAAPPTPPSADPDEGLTLADYAGDYTHADGRTMRVEATAAGLRLVVDGRSFALESLWPDAFVCTAPAYRLFMFQFARARPAADLKKGEANPVVGVSWARDTYVRPGATMPAAPVAGPTAAPLSAYEGLYVATGGWVRAARVVARDGRLWIDSFDGLAALTPDGPDRFRFEDKAADPEVIAFSPAAVAPRVMAVGEGTLIRIGDPFMDVA